MNKKKKMWTFNNWIQALHPRWRCPLPIQVLVLTYPFPLVNNKTYSIIGSFDVLLQSFNSHLEHSHLSTSITPHTTSITHHWSIEISRGRITLSNFFSKSIIFLTIFAYSFNSFRLTRDSSNIKIQKNFHPFKAPQWENFCYWAETATVTPLYKWSQWLFHAHES